jgi:phage-related protein
MLKIFTISYFETSSGSSPVTDFINHIDIKSQSKVIHLFNLLEEFGVNAGVPHVKKIVGTPLWEARTNGKIAIRFFFIKKDRHILILLHGFIKKTQKLPLKEIKLALKRATC